jgi:hypothetical protein
MLLVTPSQRLLVYNSSAAFIWNAIAAGLTLSDVASSVADAFGIDRGRASAELETIVAHWKSEGLLGASKASDEPPSVPLDWNVETDWAAVWACRFGERIVQFAVENADLVEMARHPLRPLEVTDGVPETRVEIRGRSDGRSTVLRDGRLVRDSVPREGLKEAVYEALLNFLWPGRPVDILLHAGAVAAGDAALCFPAPSGSGKTTLVAYLCGEGYQYLADDLTALDPAGDVLPLPIPLSLKEGSWRLVGDRLPALSSAPVVTVRQQRARLISPASREASRPRPLRALVFPRHRAQPGASLERVRPLDAMVRLREAGAWFGHPLTHERVTHIARWLEDVPAYALVYGGLADAHTILSRIPAASSPPTSMPRGE